MRPKHCFDRVMEEEKNKIEKTIEQAIQRVGQERDAEDIATLQRFMNSQITNDLFINEEYCIDKEKDTYKESYYGIRANISEKEYMARLASEKENLSYDAPKNSSKPIEVKHHNNKGNFFYVISSIAAIIAIVFSLNIYQDNRRMDKAFEAYYTPLEYDSQLMSRGEETISSKLTSAMEAYQNKDYTTALQKFNAMSQVDENFLIYKAICLLETDKIKDAISLLEELVRNGEGTEYYQQTCWYLALAYLRNHEDDKAVEMFQKIDNINNERTINLITQ